MLVLASSSNSTDFGNLAWISDLFEVSVFCDSQEAVRFVELKRPEIAIICQKTIGTNVKETSSLLKQHSRTKSFSVVLWTADDDGLAKSAIRDFNVDQLVRRSVPRQETEARLRAAARRVRLDFFPEFIDLGPLTISTTTLRVNWWGHDLSINGLRFLLLMALADRPGLALTRKDLTAFVWGPSKEGDPRALDVLVSQLRASMSVSDLGNPIRSIKGVGYALCIE